MEVKKSITGQKRYPRELKRLAVEKRRNENWTWSETIKWIEAEHSIKVNPGTVGKWSIWYIEDQEGRVGKSSSSSSNGGAKRWQPKEDDLLKEYVKLDLTNNEIAQFMEDTPDLNFRTYTTRSIENRKQRLNITSGIGSNLQMEDMIKECKKILPEKGITLIEYIRTHVIKVRCDICNYEWATGMSNIRHRKGCFRCSTGFVGGLPTGPEPALVYLLIFLEWKKCKLGYAQLGKSSSPEEAIHRTSKPRKYPYPYTIGAYDLSTKTKAGLLEEELKKITFENKAFIEQQEFVGHTEFRTWETIEQLREMGVFKTWLK